MKLNGFGKEARSMRKFSSGHVGQAIERVLELSADAHITRRNTPKDALAFHSLTGAIAACGKALALLTALRTLACFQITACPLASFHIVMASKRVTTARSA